MEIKEGINDNKTEESAITIFKKFNKQQIINDSYNKKEDIWKRRYKEKMNELKFIEKVYVKIHEI